MTPNQIQSERFWDTVFQSSQCEAVLGTIVRLQQKGDKFKPFTLEDYNEFCSHPISGNEELILDSFVNGGGICWGIKNYAGGGWLSKKGKNYSFTEKLIKYLLENYPSNEQ